MYKCSLLDQHFTIRVIPKYLRSPHLYLYLAVMIVVYVTLNKTTMFIMSINYEFLFRGKVNISLNIDRNVLSWSRGRGFEPRSGQTWGCIVLLAKLDDPKISVHLRAYASGIHWRPLGSVAVHFFYKNSLMVVWSKASQWHEMFCHNPEVMGLNPGRAEPGGV